MRLVSSSVTASWPLSLGALLASAPAFAATVVNTNITEAEVKAAQDGWGKALIQISDDYASGDIAKAKATANRVIDAAYGYNLGVVLFKPTLSHGAQTFRTTKAGALAYFVGDDRSFPADKGFALGGWKKYEYRNAGIFINGDLAITMGNVILTDKDGKSPRSTRPGVSRRTARASCASCCTTRRCRSSRASDGSPPLAPAKPRVERADRCGWGALPRSPL